MMILRSIFCDKSTAHVFYLFHFSSYWSDVLHIKKTPALVICMEDVNILAKVKKR